MAPNTWEYSEKRNLWQRYGLAIGLAAVGLIAVFVLYKMLHTSRGSQMKPTNLVMIRPMPPPPVPPPPPTPPQPRSEPVTQKQQMMEQAPVEETEVKPAEDNPEPEASLGTGITGNGPNDGFGLSGSGNGGRIGGSSGSGNGGGSRFGWYAAKMQRTIREALLNDSRTRGVKFGPREISFNLDASGRITSIKLGASTGDPAIDAAIKQVLVGLRMEQARPEEMPSAIHLRISASRPNS